MTHSIVVDSIRTDAEIEAAAAKVLAKRRRSVLAWQLGIMIFILLGWEFGSRFAVIDPFFWSKPTDIYARFVTWFREGTSLGPLWYQIWVTLEEAILGFFWGALAGIAVGIALGRNKFAADVFSVYIKVANAIPRIVLAPIFIMAFGLGMTSKVAVSFVMVFFVVFANAFQGVREADRAMIANARILGASPWAVTRNVIIPSALSWIFASLHVSFGFAIVGAVVGELLGSRFGIGQLIAIAQGSFDAAGMFAGMIVLIIVALLADYAMAWIESKIVRWRPAVAVDGN